MAGPGKKPTSTSGYEPVSLPFSIEWHKPKYGSDEARRLANREWYKKNRYWKQKYNEKHYRDNVDYWRDYYKKKRQATKDAQKRVDASSRNAGVMRNLKNGQAAYDLAQARVYEATKKAHDAKIEQDAARINLKLALKDYWWYVDQHKKMKVSEAWSDGFAQIRAAGKKFIDDFRAKHLS